MKGLIFGAGNIGRGFLALLLSKAGFEVIFVDTDAIKISAINEQREYPVFVVSNDVAREEMVQNIRAISALDSEAVESAIVEADLILTAVGKNALQFVAPNLAKGLLRRIKERPHEQTHVVTVACENVQDNTTYLRELLLKQVSKEHRVLLENCLSFPDCVVDRIVPNTTQDVRNVLAVSVEEYFQLAIDGGALKAPFPTVGGIEISSNLSATLEQKLCTLNMAHAIVGYYGYIKKYQYVHEAVDDRDIAQLLAGALAEVGGTITTRHPHISTFAQKEYATKVVERFRNRHLRDEVVRVARDPERKLGASDRLVRPAILTWQQGRIPAYLTSGITAALHYDYGADVQARTLTTSIKERGVARVLEEISGLPPQSEVARLVAAEYILRAL